MAEREPLLKAAGAAGAALAAVVGAWVVARVAGAGLRVARRGARFGFRAATFSLRRRCPDCKTKIPVDARVCRYCGFRLRQPRPA